MTSRRINRQNPTSRFTSIIDPVLGLAPIPGKPVQLGESVVTDLDLLRPAHRVRARPDQPDLGIAAQRPEHPPQPPVVTTTSLFSSSTCFPVATAIPWLAAAGKPAVRVVHDHPHARQRLQVFDGPIGRAVVDDDQLVWLVGQRAGCCRGTAGCIRAGCG